MADSGRDSDLKELMADVKAVGWHRGWFEYKRRANSRGHVTHDARSADWIYLSDIGVESRVLLVGGPIFVTVVALAARVREVWVLAGTEEARLVNLWRQHTGVRNVHVVRGDVVDGLPFRKQAFDLVSIGGEARPKKGKARVSFTDLARGAMRVLKPKGTACFVVGNRLWPSSLTRRGQGPVGIRRRTARGYRLTLERLEFTDVRILAPLPDHTRTPLCYLPVENSAAVNSFMRDLFPLFAAVSPEVKRAYVAEYWAARLGVWLMTIGNLGSLLRFFVPGYFVLAQWVPPYPTVNGAT